MVQQKRESPKPAMRIPPAYVTYFCKSGEVKPVKNEWARRSLNLAESCYQDIEKIFPGRELKTTNR